MGLDQWARGTVEMCPNPSPSPHPNPHPHPHPSLISNPNPRRIGLSEYLLANSLFGMLHAVVGAQPLLVLRPTGPITAITIKLSDIADRLGLDFFQYLCATGLCIALLMAAVAATELSRHIARLTAFTCPEPEPEPEPTS